VPLSRRPAAEVDVTPTLVHGLLCRQHPDLAALPLRHVASGWDNEVFRVGNELAVRVPRRALAAPLLENELRWLPLLSPGLPLPVPVPVRAGRPDETFPWPWAVVRWLPGRTAADTPPDDLAHAARALGHFVGALARAAPPDAPVNAFRGVPLGDRDASLRGRLARWGDASPVDTRAVLDRWEEALSAPAWGGPGVWLHGDLHPANLLVHRGRLSAVIDFGDLTAGDPATDLSVAWMLFGAADRTVFRDAAAATDDATWDRARGNALAHGVAVLDGSSDQPVMADLGLRTIESVLADRP
jgi:aminoglycoside phosphotransferase (APT) family kinase protein